MNKTTKEILELVFNRLSSELVDKAHQNKINSLVNDLPLVNHGIIEMYSSPKSNRVDLMLCVQKKFNEHTMLLPYVEQHDQKYLFELFRLWSDDTQLLSSVLENIYIVYDLVDLGTEISPWPYLAFSRLSLDPTVLIAIFKSASASLKGEWNNYLETRLLDCLTAADSDFHVFGFGLLQGRKEAGFRIGVSDFKSIDQIETYLKQINWNIDYQKFITKFKYLDEYAESFVLSLIIDEHFTDKIGIECVLPKENNKTCAQKFLTYLAVDERDMIIESIQHNNSISTWVNHLKVNLNGTDISTIKSYLYYEII